MPASATSWKHLPAPSERERLQFEALFTDEEFEKLSLGLVPAQMEDKWFIYFAEGWLRFHRSRLAGTHFYIARKRGDC